VIDFKHSPGLSHLDQECFALSEILFPLNGLGSSKKQMLPQSAQTNLAHKLLALYKQDKEHSTAVPCILNHLSIRWVVFSLIYCLKGALIMSDHSGTKATKEEITLELKDHSLANAEATLIQEVLQETDWNLKRSARRLKIARGTLYSKIKKHNIRRPAYPTFSERIER
jgi:DNA-binding NtrC family response regulator